MKKVLIGLTVLSGLLLTACNNKEVEARLDSIEGRVAKLEEQVKTLNDQVSLINKLLSDKFFVSSVSETDEGYRLTLVDKDGKTTDYFVHNGKNGADGTTPQVSLKQDTDGNYYWTVNGEWLLVGGQKVRANGTDGEDGANGLTPEFKVENGNWYVRLGDGAWQLAGPAVTEVTGPILGVDTTSKEGYVIFQLAGGDSIEVPLVAAPVYLHVVFDESVFITMEAGATASTDYEVKAPAGISYTFDSYEPEGWVVSITEPKNDKGVITVTLPEDTDSGKILFVLNGSDGSSFAKVVRVGVSHNTVYTLSSGAGTVPVPAGATGVTSNVSWISVSGGILNIAENDSYDSRTGIVSYVDAEGDSQNITIVQAQKDAIVLSSNTVEASPKGESLDFVLQANVKVSAASSADWVSITPTTKGLEDKLFQIQVAANNSGAAREATLHFTSGELEQTVTVTQAADQSTPSGTGDFVLVTDASDLDAGDEILIVDLDGTVTMGEQSSNNRKATAVTVANDCIAGEDLPEDACVITLSGQSGAWNLVVDGGYLANRTGNSNRLLTVETVTANATWTISIADDGNATIAASDGDRNVIRYNNSSGNSLFSCYAASSNQQAVAIYRRMSEPAAPVTDYSELGCYLRNSQWVYSAGTDQYIRSYDGTALSFVLLDPENEKVLKVSGYENTMQPGDDATLSLLWKEGRTTVLSKTYAVSVLKEEDGKVWLGDVRGNGFVIKK